MSREEDLLDMNEHRSGDDEDGRCPECGFLLSMVYPSKRTDKDAYRTCKTETCKRFMKPVQR